MPCLTAAAAVHAAQAAAGTDLQRMASLPAVCPACLQAAAQKLDCSGLLSHTRRPSSARYTASIGRALPPPPPPARLVYSPVPSSTYMRCSSHNCFNS